MKVIDADTLRPMQHPDESNDKKKKISTRKMSNPHKMRQHTLEIFFLKYEVLWRLSSCMLQTNMTTLATAAKAEWGPNNGSLRG